MGASIEVDAAEGLVTGRGEIDLSCADELRDAIESVLESQGGRPIVIDLRDVTFIDSTGVKELLRPTIDGHAVTLRQPSTTVRKVLDLAGLTGTVTIEQA